MEDDSFVLFGLMEQFRVRRVANTCECKAMGRNLACLRKVVCKMRLQVLPFQGVSLVQGSDSQWSKCVMCCC